MKKLAFLLLTSLMGIAAFGQQDPPPSLLETARGYMRAGEFDNAIVVLVRALQGDRENMDMQKDLVMCYYYKRDYSKALEGVKTLLDREDADEVTYQLAGNVYKALEQVKDCEKLYKKGLKKFPKSGPLYNEYGELLWALKDYSAIDLWEKGIQNDPGYAGNYYNASTYYFFARDKVWSLIYGEIFINMESMTDRANVIKQLLLKGYKEKLFADTNLVSGEEKNKNEFARAYLTEMNRLSSLAATGITIETLTMIRSRFILNWFNTYAARFPFKLFDYQRQLLQAGMFDAYNQWLFGPVESLSAYESWTRSHTDQYTAFNNFQKNRVFRMPSGQYYH